MKSLLPDPGFDLSNILTGFSTVYLGLFWFCTAEYVRDTELV